MTFGEKLRTYRKDSPIISLRLQMQTVERLSSTLMTIPQSTELHANQQDDVYYRMGDKSKKLNFDERLQLMYSKGARYYEDEPVYRS